MVYSALAIGLIAEEAFLVPICAQDRAVQVMTLTTLYDLADKQSQKVRVSEVALQAAYEQTVRSRQMQSAVVAEQGHHLSASEQGIEVARRAVELAQLNLSYCYIIATCDGTVGTKDIHAGQLVNPGQTLVSIVDKGERWIEANYKESQLSHIKVGNKVSITADAVPSHSSPSTMPPAIL